MKSLLLFSLLTISSLNTAWAQSDGGKTTLRIGTSSEFDTLNPIIAEQGATRYMLYLGIRPTVVLDLDMKWKPMLVTKIPTIENGMAKKKGEGLEVTYEIVPEAKWGDGTPVTCKDVEFTWQVGKNPNVSISGKEGYENVTSITWDPKTPKKCVMALKKAKFDYFASLIDPMPSHLEGPIFEKYKNEPQGYDRNTLYTKDPTNPGLYNGPYVISDVKLGSHVSFKPNPNWGGKKPYFQQIIFKLIPNGNTLPTRIQSGDIDMLVPGAGFGLDQSLAFEKTIKADKLPFKMVFEDGTVYSHIDINLDHPALSEHPVRKAMAMAINPEQINKSFFEGRAKAAYHFVTAKDPWFTEKIAKYPYNRREANKILDEAGWKMGENGYRSKNGKQLSLTIMGVAGNKIIDNIEAFLQAQWKAIGIELKIKNEPARVFFGDTVNHRKFDLAFFSWTSIPDQSPRTTLHSTQIPSEANAWSGQNYTGYKNPEVDKWIEAIELEFNAKKRADLGKKIIEAYVRDIPVFPIYYRPNSNVIPADMTGYRLAGHVFYETLYAETWARK